MTATPSVIEKRPLLAAEAVDDGPLVAGCGKKIGVKAQGMGYVMVDIPAASLSRRQQTATPGASPTALQQWGAVAVALVNSLGGRPKARHTPAPDCE